MTLVQHPPCASPPPQPNTVQLLSRTYKPADELLSGEQGILLNDAGALGQRQFDPAQFAALERLADSTVLRQAYLEWYKKGGRQVEKELLQRVQLLAQNTQWKQNCQADRFRDVVRRGLVLEEEEDEPDLLNMCKQAIAEHGKCEPESFIELQDAIRECNGNIHQSPTRGTVEQAAQRQLKHTEFAIQLARQL